jgi:peptidyl-prolyl cis-trans isomerase C
VGPAPAPLIAAGLALLAGCAGGRVSGSESGEDVAPPVAVVAGRPLPQADLVRHWWETDREAYTATLEDLVDRRVAAEEAGRLGLSVPPAALDAAVAAEVRARETQLAAAYGAHADLAAVVEEAYGTDLAGWRRDVLRPRLAARLLLQRVVRADARRRPRLGVRVIVVEDRDRALRTREKILAGADFARTAFHESRDPSAREGGALPSFARGDLAWPEVERRLFELPVGALAGPWEVRVDGRAQWHLYRVTERVEPWPEVAAAFAARLEADLAARPADRAELLAWRARVRRDLGVTLHSPDGAAIRPHR